MQLSIPYELVGPDGARAVIGNSDVARADPDWVGFVDPETGITGLDGADSRGSVETLTEADGAYVGPVYDGARPVVLHVILDPSAPIATLNEYERKLKRATRGMRDDAFLRYTPDELGIELELRLRRNGKPNITGRRPKVAQIPMIAADSARRAALESSAAIIPTGEPTTAGYGDPYSDPYSTEAGATAQVSMLNEGDLDAIPRHVITGPITNPEILNNTTGERIKLTYTLAAGETLEVDVARKTVLFGGVTSKFSAVVFPTSRWWRLQPGANDVRLLASAYSAGARLDTYWRRAYE